MNAWLLINDSIQSRLRKRWLVSFIVAPSSKAIHVDNNIALKFSTKIHSQTDNLCNRLRIFTVYMEYWNLQHLCNIGCVHAGTRFLWPGCESNLIIHDHMERPANTIGIEFTEIKRLLNNSLSRKSGITVNQNHHAVLASSITRTILAGTHSSNRNWIYIFQMAWIKAKRQVHFTAIFSDIVRRVP